MNRLCASGIGCSILLFHGVWMSETVVPSGWSVVDVEYDISRFVWWTSRCCTAARSSTNIVSARPASVWRRCRATSLRTPNNDSAPSTSSVSSTRLSRRRSQRRVIQQQRGVEKQEQWRFKQSQIHPVARIECVPDMHILQPHTQYCGTVEVHQRKPAVWK